MLTAPPQYDMTTSSGASWPPWTRSRGRSRFLSASTALDGSGKTSLASWLTWKLGIPAIHLALFVDLDASDLAWRTDDLRRMLDTRLHPENPRPVVVEGILLLDALEQAGGTPDLLVYVEKRGNKGAYYLGRDHVRPYLRRRRPKQRADFILRWKETPEQGE